MKPILLALFVLVCWSGCGVIGGNNDGDNTNDLEEPSCANPDEHGVNNDTNEGGEEEDKTPKDSDPMASSKLTIDWTDDLLEQIHRALHVSGVASSDKARIQEIALAQVHLYYSELEREEELRAERDRILEERRATDEEPKPDFPYRLNPPPPSLEDGEYSLDFVKHWKPPGGRRFGEYADGNSPYRIPEPVRDRSDEIARLRRPYVQRAMQHAWDGYRQYAFGDDEVRPQTQKGTNHWGGISVTLVDSLDTLWVMKMRDEFEEARDYVRDDLSHDQDSRVSVFETTIRSLGGLLSAYDWSRDEVFLEEALDLARRLMRAFDHPLTGATILPFGEINLKDGSCNMIPWAGGNAILSEFGTLQIEFRYLDEIMRTAETRQFRDKVEHIFETLHEMSPDNGLFPYYMKTTHLPGRGKNNQRKLSDLPKPFFNNDHLTFGAMADSFYEYMLKIWLQGGKTEPMYRDMYDKAMQGMHDELLHISTPSGLTYLADRVGTRSVGKHKRTHHKMDHLCCFVGGMLALGAYTDPLGLESFRAQRDLQTAKALTYTCYQMYARTKTGISPEYVEFVVGEDFHIGKVGPHYLLRPEAIESFYILNVLTGDPIYREWGWEVFLAIEKYCKTKIAYGSLKNVEEDNSIPRDDMESFFLAETLKYLYLLNDPDSEIDILNKHVFNTEAHAMRMFPIIEEDMKNESLQS